MGENVDEEDGNVNNEDNTQQTKKCDMINSPL